MLTLLPSDFELSTTIAETGHFCFESGHHGTLWLHLDNLFCDPKKLSQAIAILAEPFRENPPDFVCGPALGGAFVAQLMALELNTRFLFTERHLIGNGESIEYRVPPTFHPSVSASKIVLVDDAINAGSALLASHGALQALGSSVTAYASLIASGAFSPPAEFSQIPLYTLVTLDRPLWHPSECPLCQQNIPLAHHP